MSRRIGPGKIILLIAFMAAFAIFALGCSEKTMNYKAEPYCVNTDDLDCCNEQRGIVGESGRVLSLYRVEEFKRRTSYGWRHYEIRHLYYYIFDNASSVDIKKMRNDRSYVPDNYRVYSFYTSDENKKKELDGLCVQWDAYMNRSSDAMPAPFYINGYVSTKSFNEDDVWEFKNAARKYGFAENQITSLLIFDDTVSTYSVTLMCFIFIAIAAVSALVVWIIQIIKRWHYKRKY